MVRTSTGAAAAGEYGYKQHDPARNQGPIGMQQVRCEPARRGAVLPELREASKFSAEKPS